MSYKVANGGEKQKDDKASALSLVKDVFGIAVILGGFLSSVVAGAIWVDDLNDRLVEARTDIDTSTALITAQDAVLRSYEARLKTLETRNAPSSTTQPSPSLKEQQCVNLAQQRRAARGKTAAAVQAAMNALGCAH